MIGFDVVSVPYLTLIADSRKGSICLNPKRVLIEASCFMAKLVTNSIW